MTWKDNRAFCKKVVGSLTSFYPRAWKFISGFYVINEDALIRTLKNSLSDWRKVKSGLKIIESYIQKNPSPLWKNIFENNKDVCAGIDSILSTRYLFCDD